MKPQHPFEAKARSNLANGLHARRRFGAADGEVITQLCLPKTWKCLCPLKRVAGVMVTRWTCGEARFVLSPPPRPASACLPGRTTASLCQFISATQRWRQAAGPMPGSCAHSGGSLTPLTGQMSRTWQVFHPGFLPESEVIFLFRRLPAPRICFHPPGSTFNSSHGQVRKTDLGSLMRGRTRTHRRSDSPAGITAGEPLNPS